MSSTNRTALRHPNDQYETPTWCVKAIIPKLPRTPHRILEPAAGSGAIVKVLRDTYRDASILAVDVDRAYRNQLSSLGCTGLITEDFLTLDLPSTYDLVVMNPPFKDAMAFVKRCRELSRCVAALLRLPWLASRQRRSFHQQHPSDVYVLPKRPSFTKDQKTDSCDYAWFVWGEGRGGQWRVL